jgi:nucleoid-associated protein YgaU
MNYKNASYNKFGSVDCEIDHPVFGWIPFTASPDDVEEHGREIFAAAQATAAAYVEPPADLTALAAAARAQRNTLLQQSDWTQVADAPVDQAAWATYRQALRDITAQAGFPETINWPVAPE